MKTIKHKENIKSKFIKVDSYDLETESGQIINRDCVDKPEGVCAVVFNTSTNKFIFVKQYRIGSQNYQIELPAGIIESLSPEETISNEIEEETGYKVDHLLKLITFYTSPGYSSEKQTLFYAEVSQQISLGGGLSEEGEHIEIVDLSEEEIKNTKFEDARALIGLFYLNLI